MEEKIIKLASEVFNQPIDSLTFSKSDTDKWDSMSHIMFVMQLEKEFNVNFEQKEILKMYSNLSEVEEVLTAKNL